MAVIYFLQCKSIHSPSSNSVQHLTKLDMDKQTLSISSVFGIIHDANLIGREYSILGSIVSWVPLSRFPPLLTRVPHLASPNSYCNPSQPTSSSNSGSRSTSQWL